MFGFFKFRESGRFFLDWLFWLQRPDLSRYYVVLDGPFGDALCADTETSLAWRTASKHSFGAFAWMLGPFFLPTNLFFPLNH